MGINSPVSRFWFLVYGLFSSELELGYLVRNNLKKYLPFSFLIVSKPLMNATTRNQKPETRNSLSELKLALGVVHDLNAAAHVLEWDQETYMPKGAAEARAHQIGTLRQMAHERFISDEVGDLLKEAQEALVGMDPMEDDAALVRVTMKDFEKAQKLPSDLVAEMARTVSQAKQAWKEARETNMFSTFAPLLERLIDLNIQKADAYGHEGKAYDALLDEYEPGMKTEEVEQIFSSLRDDLVPLVHSIMDAPAPDNSFLFEHFDHQKQWDFGIDVITDFGYDFERGRQDVSAHPFTTSFSITDVRLTTRIQEDYFPTGLFGTLHEAGHGLYEQGVSLDFDRTPLAQGTSLGMHESQSRLWENLVGRSRGFWSHYYPKLQALFPERLADKSLDTFYRAINKVSPSLIRVEADEVTYNLHIMLRFQLENALIAGDLTVNDLPDAWNATMQEYLGLKPDTDSDGVLQDIHWSLGIFGYFPTYALGNLMSTQLFNQIRKDVTDIEHQIASGHFGELLSWLRTHVHHHGRKLTASDILQRATGESLSSESWVAYVEEKYSAIYR